MSPPTWSATRLKRELRRHASSEARAASQRFFREEVRILGLRAAQVREIARRAAREYREAKLPVERILGIADRLWSRGAVEERILAVEILRPFVGRMGRATWEHLDGWVETLSNWAETDALSGHLLAPLLRQEPELLKKLLPWTRRRHRWRRRAACASMVLLARGGEHLEVVFELAQRLARVRDDMVEKGLGWMLKSATKTAPGPVVDFLLDHRDELSRLTLRYACENLPPRLTRRVLQARASPRPQAHGRRP